MKTKLRQKWIKKSRLSEFGNREETSHVEEPCVFLFFFFVQRQKVVVFIVSSIRIYFGPLMMMNTHGIPAWKPFHRLLLFFHLSLIVTFSFSSCVCLQRAARLSCLLWMVIINSLSHSCAIETPVNNCLLMCNLPFYVVSIAASIPLCFSVSLMHRFDNKPNKFNSTPCRRRSHRIGAAVVPCCNQASSDKTLNLSN